MWELFKRSPQAVLTIIASLINLLVRAQISYDAPDWDSLYRPNAPWVKYYSEYSFSHTDTLHGTYTKYRRFWDVIRYELTVRLHIEEESIEGTSRIIFEVVENSTDSLQIDLHHNFQVESLKLDGRIYSSWDRVDNFIWVRPPEKWTISDHHSIEIKYHGKPVKAPRPPWDGGFVWSKDRKGRPWIGVACEGDGAMLWWACKDQLVDEPDSGILFRIEIPNQEGLMAVANGNLVDSGIIDAKWKYFTWQTQAPINIYNVTLYVGHLIHWEDEYLSQHPNTRGKKLRLDYYILDYDVEASKAHFPSQVKASLETFESYWGPFPFWEDGLALVHAPYWGMEHQTAVAYGHNFSTNPYGFDYIILHELAHEYWGNSVSAFDFGDVWIHEGLATYTEVLHVERTKGRDKAQEYIQRKQRRILNKYPVMMPRGVYKWLPRNDMYPKGAWIMHTLRHWLAPNDHRKWVEMMRRFYAHFSHSIVTTEEVIDYWTQYDSALIPFWKQYLMHPTPPIFQYHQNDTTLCFRWKTDVKDFQMPFEWQNEKTDRWHRIYPTHRWQTIAMKNTVNQLEFNTDQFYVKVERVDRCGEE